MPRREENLWRHLAACVRRLQAIRDEFPDAWDGVSEMVLQDALGALGEDPKTILPPGS